MNAELMIALTHAHIDDLHAEARRRRRHRL